MTAPFTAALSDVSLRCGDAALLQGVTIEIACGQPVTVVGGRRAERSALLRLLSGSTEFLVSGAVSVAGAPLSRMNHGVSVVVPRWSGDLGARDLAQGRSLDRALEALGACHLAPLLDVPFFRLAGAQRQMFALAFVAASGAPLLTIDEPTAGFGAAEIVEYAAALRCAAQATPIIVATEDLHAAREFGGTVAFLSEGRLADVQPAPAFFASPRSAARALVAGPQLAETIDDGATWPDGMPALSGLAERPTVRDVAAYAVPPQRHGTRHKGLPLHPTWVLSLPMGAGGRLGGCRRPGIVADFDAEMQRLRAAGVDVLVCLESEPLDPVAVRRHGIAAVEYPYAALRASEGYAGLVEACRAIDELLRIGCSVCVQCRTGLGRTGTVLAAYLIWKGASAREAMARVRLHQRRYVQTAAQEQLLCEFDRALDAVSGDRG